jgi:hypothetical protein
MGGWAATVAVVALAVMETGCYVTTTRVADAGPVFAQARLEAVRQAGRTGRASQINVLVYDPKDERLIRVSVPMWLAKKLDHAEWKDVELDDDTEDVGRLLRKRIRLADLERAGLGTYVDVEEDDGEQVLVWLK